jgi:hypothetical protein
MNLCCKYYELRFCPLLIRKVYRISLPGRRSNLDSRSLHTPTPENITATKSMKMWPYLLLLASIASANVLPVVAYALLTTTPTFTTPTSLALDTRWDDTNPPSCQESALAVPGDTCQSMADKNGLSLASFVSINPQIGGLANCPGRVWAYTWYCIMILPETWATNLIPGPTPLSPANSAAPPKPATATANHPPSPPPTTLKTTPAPPTPTSCALNDCYRGFALAAYGAAKSQSSWCTSLLQASPPITHIYYSDFPGAGPVVSKMCHHGKDEVPNAEPAHMVYSRYCACYAAGALTGPVATRVNSLPSVPLRRAV